MIFIFLYISISFACEIVSSVTNLYPSQNEVYKLDMSQLFDGYNLTYDCLTNERKKCPAGVTVENVLTDYPIYNNTLTTNLVKSADSMYNNYVTITTDEVNLYQFSETTYQMENIATANLTLNCFNVIFFNSSNQIMDCYNGNNLTFLSFNQTTLFSTPSAVPLWTKMISDRKSLLLYAQFYGNQSVLTLYNYTNNRIMYIKNLTNLSTFTDITVTYNQDILILNETYTLYKTIWQLQNFSTLNISIWPQKQLALKYYQSFQNEVHNEFLFIVTDKPFENIQQYFYNNNTHLTPFIIYEADQIFNANSSIQIQISDEFLIVAQYSQQNYFYKGWIQFNQSLLGNSYKQQLISQNMTQSFLFLNQITNFLIKFDTIITGHSLAMPKLKIQNTDINTSNIIIIAIDRNSGEQRICNKTLNYTLLNDTDTNIYPTNNSPGQTIYIVQNLSSTVQLNELYSGPLLNYNCSQDPGQDVNFTITCETQTFNQTNIITTNNQSNLFQNVDVSGIYLIEESNILFVVWSDNTRVTYIFCTSLEGINYICDNSNLQVINCSATSVNSIQIGQYFQQNENYLIFALNQGNFTIQIYQLAFKYDKGKVFNVTQTLIYSKTNQSCSIQQFFLLSVKLIVFCDQQIFVEYFLQNTTTVINSTTINNLTYPNTPQINFQPQNISINSKYFASILFINNKNSIIILQILPSFYINNTELFVILNYTEFNSPIYQLNIVEYNLIVSYFQNGSIILNVQDIADLTHPKFLKYLPTYNIISNCLSIQSDNIFLYLLTENNIMYVYSVFMSYHSSLYYQFNYTGNYFSVSNARFFSIVFFNNTLYQLRPYFPVSISDQVYNISRNITNTTTIFNTTINVNLYNNLSNPLTDNITIMLFNTYTTIELNETQFNSTQNSFNFGHFSKAIKPITRTVNLTDVWFGQILNYSIVIHDSKTKKNFTDRSIATISNYLIPQMSAFSYNLVNLTQIVSWNSTFFIFQNSTGLYATLPLREGKLIQSYYNNFTRCLSLSVNDSLCLNSICENTQSQINMIYTINNISNSTYNTFTLNYTSISNQTLPNRFNHIVKSYVYDKQLLFILGSQGSIFNLNQLYIYKINDSTLDAVKIRKTQIHCDRGITDFNITTLLNETDLNLTLIKASIFYTCQQTSRISKTKTSLRYLGFTITNSEIIKFYPIYHTVHYFNQFAVYGTQFLQVKTLRVQYDQILLLLTTSNLYSFLFIMSFSSLQQKSELLQFEDIVGFIPPYGNFLQAPDAVLNGDYLILQYYTLNRQIYQSILGIYNISQKTIQNCYTNSLPLMMLAGYNQTLYNFSASKIALIPNTTNSTGAYMMGIYTDVTKEQMSTKVVNILYNNQTYFIGKPDIKWKDYSFYLLAENSFGSMSIPWNITVPNDTHNVIPWIMFLLTIVLCVIGIVWFFRFIKNPEQKEEEQLPQQEERYQEIEM